MRSLLGVFGAGLLALFALPASAADPSPVGLWSYAERFDTGVSGELTLTRQGDVWRGAIGGASAEARAKGGELRLAFPDGGSFRGRFDKGAVSGFWARRAVTDDPRYPFGQALSYAAPLALKAAGPNRWRATVAPLSDTFTLYLKVFRDKDGGLRAAFRNPETHSHGPAMQYAVVQTGEAVRFDADPGDGPPGKPLEARLSASGDRITLRWEDLGKSIDLKPVAPEAADRFFPQPPGGAPYVYRVPARTADGWKVARAGDLGLDEAALAKLVQRIMDIDPTSSRSWLIHSIAVAYKGRLVLDEYFYGFGRDEPHDTRSASKTFSSVMLGGLIREGSDLSPATKVYEVMAPLGPFANPDPRKAKITLKHLLTHSAGLACDDNAESSPGNEDMIESDRSQPDWVKRTLDLPMAYEPGEHFAYCSMNINMAGAVLRQHSGEWIPALFDRTVARPLKFGPYHWNITPTGEGYLGGGVFVRTRDFLKLGQAYMDGGAWNGRRIVSDAWVKQSWAPHMRISPATTGVSGEAFTNNYWEVDEGLAWHMINVRSGGKTYPAYHANGNGGQLLLVMPQFDLVVMFTAGNYGQGLWNRERDDLVGGMILPALPSR